MKKTNVLKSLVCLILIVSMSLLPLTSFAASKAYILTVTGDKVNMHSSATSSSVTAKLSKGTKVLYWGSRSKTMCKVATTSGKVGYVYRNYLSVYGAINKSQVYVTTSSTSVYKRSGSSLKKFTTVSSGRYLLVLGKASGWAYVRTVSGKAGYVPTSAIKKAF